MDDGRLDQLEQVLLRHARGRSPMAAPAGFTEGVMRAVRAKVEARNDFWSLFSLAGSRFAPAGALVASAACAYALMSERLLTQAVVSLSLHGTGGTYILAGLMP